MVRLIQFHRSNFGFISSEILFVERGLWILAAVIIRITGHILTLLIHDFLKLLLGDLLYRRAVNLR